MVVGTPGASTLRFRLPESDVGAAAEDPDNTTLRSRHQIHMDILEYLKLF
jgi:hypothetical protein